MDTPELILKYIEALVWPVVAVIILLTFRKEFSGLLSRAKKVELPGGISIEAFEAKLRKAKALEKEIVAERKPQATQIIEKHQPELNTQKNIIRSPLGPTAGGQNIAYYRSLADTDPRLALAGLKVDLELMLRQLAEEAGLESVQQQTIDEIIFELLSKNVINAKKAEFTQLLLQLTGFAARGGELTKTQVDSLLELGQTLIEDYTIWLQGGNER